MTDPQELAVLRHLLNEVLRTDADLEAFCLDYFPQVHCHFAQGQSRVAKTTLLLQIADREEILNRLRQHDPNAVEKRFAPGQAPRGLMGTAVAKNRQTDHARDSGGPPCHEPAQKRTGIVLAISVTVLLGLLGLGLFVGHLLLRGGHKMWWLLAMAAFALLSAVVSYAIGSVLGIWQNRRARLTGPVAVFIIIFLVLAGTNKSLTPDPLSSPTIVPTNSSMVAPEPSTSRPALPEPQIATLTVQTYDGTLVQVGTYKPQVAETFDGEGPAKLKFQIPEGEYDVVCTHAPKGAIPSHNHVHLVAGKAKTIYCYTEGAETASTQPPDEQNIPDSLGKATGTRKNLNEPANLVKTGRRQIAQPQSNLVSAKLSSTPGLADSLANLAALQEAEGHYKQALETWRKVLEIRRKLFGSNHPIIAETIQAIAKLHIASGAFSDALPLQRQALRIYEQSLGPEHPLVASALNQLAGTLIKVARYGDAAPLVHRALDIRRKSLGPSHPDEIPILENLALLYEKSDNFKKLDDTRKEIDLLKKKLGMITVSTKTSNQTISYNAELIYGEQSDDKLQICRELTIDDVIVNSTAGHTTFDVRIRNASKKVVNVTRATIVPRFKIFPPGPVHISACYMLSNPKRDGYNDVPISHSLKPDEVDRFLIDANFANLCFGYLRIKYNGGCYAQYEFDQGCAPDIEDNITNNPECRSSRH